MPGPDEHYELSDDQIDELTTQEYLEYLDRVGALHADGTIDHSKLKYHPAQKLSEVEALMWEGDDQLGSPPDQ